MKIVPMTMRTSNPTGNLDDATGDAETRTVVRPEVGKSIASLIAKLESARLAPPKAVASR